MNFADSLKKWFFNNSSQAASSDARIPLLNADGTPKGSDTMANIASVLGGIQVKTPQSDINNLIASNLLFQCPENATGSPFSAGSGGGFVIQLVIESNVRLQIAIINSGAKVFIRTQWYSNTFGDWFQYN